MIQAPGNFSTTLLSEPVEVRMAYFKNLIVAHPHFMEAYNGLLEIIQCPKGIRLIFVIGAGTGVTQLQRHLHNTLIEAEWARMQECPGFIPALSTEAVAPGLKSLNWKDFLKRTLRELQEPLVEYKINYSKLDKSSYGSLKYLQVRNEPSEPDLSQALKQCMHYRQLKVFTIDEAQYFGKRLTDQQSVSQREKFLEFTGNVMGILFGNYDLRHLAAVHPPFHLIHLKRYRAEYLEELEIFKNLLWTLQHVIPLPKPPNLIDHWEYFYEGSLGCFGLLKDWLDKALFAALEDNQRTLSQKYLTRFAIGSARLYETAGEIIEGEKAVEEMIAMNDPSSDHLV